ncbi:DUF397 domain-containing protein [Nonomuraea rhizosphaerae]|uniref:DUF397 domain-containing protein n=1 Tax=Nonomuraea rhizosphaerae TaxID=2665663 RepID=UPI001C5E124B|nr:DUF397 domain-containing protein [Nonomuraea rhizosphaerae]
MGSAKESRSHDAAWFKATFSDNGGGCVEVALGADGVAVRDSKDPDGPVLRFSDQEWCAFLAGVHAGEFDLR